MLDPRRPNTTMGREMVASAKERLNQGRRDWRMRHQDGLPGVQVCAGLTELLDRIVLELYQAALGELSLGEAPPVALAPHGGYGRRDAAPYSDVDLMLLYDPSARPMAMDLARRLTQDICDCGLKLGFSFRTPRDACHLALEDMKILTSLVEARFLAGSVRVFAAFMARFRSDVYRRRRSLIAKIEKQRREERHKFGETVYLLEPNVKGSRGALRDIQLARWVGFVTHGESDIDDLFLAGALTKRDRNKLRRARDYLLRLRNELHFFAGRAQDSLDRSEQVRLAKLHGFESDPPCDSKPRLLAVEKFMRTYFEHTSEVRYTVANFVDAARNVGSARSTATRTIGLLFTHQADADFRVGPRFIGARRQSLNKVQSDVEQVLRLMELASLYNKRIDPATWEAIRAAGESKSASQRPAKELSLPAREHFLSLMSQSDQLGELLRKLHQLRVLEQIIPAVKHARCLLQFNEYHKYTVDEHSLRAVERATDFWQDQRLVGKVYRSLKQKRTLHLALLLHDLGKGFSEDHSEVGLRIAEETARRLNLPSGEAETLKLLVHKHLLMSHLSTQRDLNDPAVIVQCAVETGSPEVLKMLYVLSCADLAAVGPGVLTDWKLNLLTQLYDGAMQHLAGDHIALGGEKELGKLRQDVHRAATKHAASKHAASPACQPDEAWWRRQIDAIPASYLRDVSPARIVSQLTDLANMQPDQAAAWSRYLPQRDAVEYSVGAYESLTAGIFHRLTGVLTSQGHQILAAEINSLADGLVLDRFFVNDLDYSDEPPAPRQQEIQEKLVAVLTRGENYPPKFRRIWKADKESAADIHPQPTRVRIDNNTSEQHTIIDVIAHDRMGLLYTITHMLFTLGVSVRVAKIGTYLDQVVDVFYVTDEQGEKIEDENQLHEIRRRLLEAIAE